MSEYTIEVQEATITHEVVDSVVEKITVGDSGPTTVHVSSVGVQGPPGPAGSGTGGGGTVGPAGPAGPQGPQGLKGDKGDTGAQGIQGPQGLKGDTGNTGTAATITVGTVTTGAAGSSASVINVGTSSAATLNFTIPRGEQGIQGIQGIQGVKGDTGATGPQGPAGADAPSQATNDLRYVQKLNDTINLTNPTTMKFVDINITDDGSNTANWPERLRFLFNGKLTSRFNEYGEFRGSSGKANTVAMRLFTKETDAEANHSTTVPIFEVVLSRQTRTNVFNIMADGSTTQAGKMVAPSAEIQVPSGPTLSVGYLVLATGAAVPANTPAGTLIVRT